MKRILSSAVVTSLFLLSSASFALNSNPTIIKEATFAPVSWHATRANGGFGLTNYTSDTMYVQVIVNKGEVYVYDTSADGSHSCKEDLNAKTGQNSITCEVAPMDSFGGDIDYAKLADDASGTYQIQMANSVKQNS